MTSPSASLPAGVHTISPSRQPASHPLARTRLAVLGDNQCRQVVDVGQECVVECAEEASAVTSSRLAKGDKGGCGSTNRLFDVTGVHLRRLRHCFARAGVCGGGQ